jgi:hypothetical protein
MANTPYSRAAEFEERAARAEIGDLDIHLSRLTGMSPADIEHLRAFTATEALLIVIRCPKRPARYFHGKYPAKRYVTKAKSDPSTGLVINQHGGYEVSDYDLMCVYRLAHDRSFEKIPFSGTDPARERSPLSPEATIILRKVNADLQSPFQHGAQDDFLSARNPGVRLADDAARQPPDRFAAFHLGLVDYLPNPQAARAYYRKHGLAWPYDAGGRHQGHP